MPKKLKLYAERTKHNLTQKQVATAIGLTKQGYSHIERGYRNPSWKLQKRLEQFFGIPASELLAEGEEEKV
jgi:putative transcriptional regulator